MTRRLPRAARIPAVATLPPHPLSGLDPAFSRLVTVPESGAGHDRTWHILDNGQTLAALGVEPVGTILCVHGNPTWSYLWRRLVSQATDAAANGQEAWRVIAVDQLDMGFSERTGVPRPLARRVSDLADLTDHLGVNGPVVTFGHDWGGSISLGWALDHPDQLAGVMLLNTAVHQPEEHAVPAPLRLALGKGILGAATVVTPAFLETTLALAHPALDAEVKTGYRAPYRGAARRGGIGAFVADIPIDAAHESSPELDRIAAGLEALEVPALMLWGPRDPIFSDLYLDDLLGRLPQADVHRFEGCGHLLAEDADYAGAALTWLADLGLEPFVPPIPLVEAPVSTGSTQALVEARRRSDRDPASQSSDPTRLAGSRSLVPRASTGGSHDGSRSLVPRASTGGSRAAAWATGTRPLWHYLDELRDSDETALVDMAPRSGRTLVVSWRLLSQRVRRLAAGLDRIGVRHGDRVSLLVPPGADLTAVLYACVRIGAIVVVADAGLGLRGLTRAVRGARPDFVIGAAPGLAAARALGWPGTKIATARFPTAMARTLGVEHTLAELIELGADECLPAAPGPDDTAAVLFTSGSTGPAKGVVYTHGQLSAVAVALFAQYGVGVGTGLVAGFAPFALLGPALGARSVTPDMDVTSPKTLTATAVAAAVAAIDATVVFLSPAALANVVATAEALTPADHSALVGVRTFLSAGAPVSEPLLAAASRLMPNASAHTPYGMTEGLLMADISLEGIRAAAQADNGVGGVCVGVGAATTQIRLSALDGHGEATGEPSEQADVTGEILVSAPHVKDHYDRLWVTDRASRRAVPAGARWHRTGDVGHLDSEGRLWVEGRLPHVIVTASGVVTPVGPEQRIESVAGVGRAAVVGVGPVGTEQVVAIVETVPGVRRVALRRR
ncbi:alpha/beta fold hydrolase, partial [Cryobacterium sp. MLB-32]|uniref:alpha/beta fold hydrolase n=1 Tax=Cryobacterium sp. MLB-32 TaxID=1529318 RepID=UPI00068B0110